MNIVGVKQIRRAAKEGKDGVSATYVILPSTTSVSKNSSGTLTPNTISAVVKLEALGVTEHVNVSTPIDFYGRNLIYKRFTSNTTANGLLETFSNVQNQVKTIGRTRHVLDLDSIYICEFDYEYSGLKQTASGSFGFQGVHWVQSQ